MLDFLDEKSSVSVFSAPPQLQSKPLFFSLLWPAHTMSTAVSSSLIQLWWGGNISVALPIQSNLFYTAVHLDTEMLFFAVGNFIYFLEVV